MTSATLSSYKRLVMLAGFASVSTAILLVVIKLAVWLASGSSAMFASLTDSLFDSLASLVNLIALRYSVAPADKEHRFGHFKAQSLASLAQAAFIGGSAVLLIAHGLERCLDPHAVNYALLAIVVSMVTMLLTLGLVCFQAFVYARTKSEAIGADRFHYLSDIVLNLGVVLALILSYYGMLWADGMFASLIGIFILWGAAKIAIKAVKTLLDESLEPQENLAILQAITRVEQIVSVHDLKTRRAGPQVYIQGHLVIDGHMPLYRAHQLANAAEEQLLQLYPDADISLHMEPDNKETAATVIFVEKDN